MLELLFWNLDLKKTLTLRFALLHIVSNLFYKLYNHCLDQPHCFVGEAELYVLQLFHYLALVHCLL